MTTEPATTPIENQAHRSIHNAAFDAVIASGGHWECATECGFLAVEEVTGQPGKLMAKPCTVCLAVWRAWKKQRGA